jgi:hypothetical protein
MCVHVNVIEKFGKFNHGTGSYPLPPHGWQRAIRFTASHSPFIGPCFFNASSAYWLQVGVKRHDGGVNGDMQAL